MNRNNCVETSTEICQMELWKASILEHYQIINEEHTQVMHMEDKGKFYIVSDGREHDFKGTFGVIISDRVNILASNKGKIYSVDYLESAYRSEMYGVFSGLVTFQEEIGRAHV